MGASGKATPWRANEDMESKRSWLDERQQNYTARPVK